jgi:hypothetical protein
MAGLWPVSPGQAVKTDMKAYTLFLLIERDAALSLYL